MPEIKYSPYWVLSVIVITHARSLQWLAIKVNYYPHPITRTSGHPEEPWFPEGISWVALCMRNWVQTLIAPPPLLMQNVPEGGRQWTQAFLHPARLRRHLTPQGRESQPWVSHPNMFRLKSKLHTEGRLSLVPSPEQLTCALGGQRFQRGERMHCPPSTWPLPILFHYPLSPIFSSYFHAFGHWK